ncbi:helix-turn-helix transcriptional regulator [Caldimonas brevitalea]|uniref:Regulatory protein n=1 Tax=Caldimonas brevitalea TaxID=413882 RepID=A0A0G3BWJ7_9BURK|nr:LuxR family transcriptional regulator [Caldimonas brevitalea]AKJ30910.1 regulatory protein [Caldimonas brevitalea]
MDKSRRGSATENRVYVSGLSAHAFADQDDTAGALVYADPPKRYDVSQQNPSGPTGPAVPPILAELLRASGLPQRRQALSFTLQRLGLSWLGYARMTCAGGRATPIALCSAHEDESWVRRYLAAQYWRIDPRLPAAASASLPLLWETQGLRQMGGQPASLTLLRFVADLEATGARAGITVSVPSGTGADRYFITLTSTTLQVESLYEVLQPATLLALAVHDFYSRYTVPPVHPAGPEGQVTPIQRRILQALRRGLSDKEIAAVVQTTRANVDYHMRKLRKRFSVQNRVQLLQVAQGLVPV